MPTSKTRCAIMFADVCGSSSLYKVLGNHAAEYKIRNVLEQATRLVEKHVGTLVKTLGDEVMARFDDMDDAFDAAVAIQRFAVVHGGSLQLRIGLNYGETLLKHGDVFGETVNDAAFVAQIARAEEIILTEACISELAPDRASRCREFDRIAPKGGAEKTLIYRAQWQPEKDLRNATQVTSLLHSTQQASRQILHILCQGKNHQIIAEQTPFHLGRARESNLHIDSNFASRDHCHILYRRGKFVLIDHSTNGTYVTPKKQREIYLRREELPLEGGGVISLGCPASSAPFILIYHFTDLNE